MATDSLSSDVSTDLAKEYELLKEAPQIVRAVLRPMASLRLTVSLFAMAIFIIFVGTLAQVDKDMWQVIEDYFRSVFAWIDFQVFFPRSWFPSFADRVPGGFYFPGGALIGAAMAINLLAAHLVRFKIQAKGPTLLLGLAIIGVGSVITYWVIASGHNTEGLQGQPNFSWESLWSLVKYSLTLIALASGFSLALFSRLTKPQQLGLLGLALTSGGLAVWLFASAGTMPSPSSMRILWQLIQGGLAGVVLLIGCLLVFRKRAGIVLLHAGIGLIMFSEFFVSKYAVEGRMTIREGETVNYVRDIRKVELAVIDASPSREDVVVAVPGTRLEPNQTVQHEQLPFDIFVKEYIPNSDLRERKDGEATFADSGSGTSLIAEPLRASSGTDGGQVDLATAYVEFRKKGTDESLGRYMLSQILASSERPEVVEVDGKPYDVFLRFKREYKPYRMALKDVRKDDYLGTDTPMNYSSDIRLVDEQRNTDRDLRIWMNNPLRYAGETFYQSGYNVDRRDGTEITDLQVVTNTGWMMPYVGCMLVTVGMLMHFSSTLARFITRQARGAAEAADRQSTSWLDWGLPAIVVLLCAGYVGSKMRAPDDTKAGMKIQEAGKLPVVYQGRVKPLDTLARNSLRVVSNKETFKDIDGNEQPAIRWLLDVISGSPDAATHPVFRIDNLEVLETLGLQRRKRFRYAENEFRDNLEAFEKQLQEARKLDVADLSVYQRKLIETERRIRTVRLLEAAFTPLPFPAMPTQAEFEQDKEATGRRLDRIKELLLAIPRVEEMLARMQPPLTVPVEGEEDWLPYATAWNQAFIANIKGESVPEATLAWTELIAAYRDGDTNQFNDAVAAYQAVLDSDEPAALAEANVPFEYFFNYARPFTYSLVLYIVSFVLVALAWLFTFAGKFTVLNRTAFWLILFTLGLHTFALAARIEISGRPPVTNLYSSAVFIGWAAVLLGLIFERIYRIGIGNAIAAFSGFSTLFIAYGLAADGDTFTVLQAVLDTQFWLATHVVCVTLGYSTTFVAGLLGAVYLVVAAINKLNPDKQRRVNQALTSMTYGTLCFALYFSFVGTVLGGLWADDSWGRFWGWDPKENGALIIVLWNALILHARWGGMIKQRGLAMLAVFGNITTAWSWFGVNELGVGLHSYGFTEGVLRNLGLFVLSQVVIILLGFASMLLTTGGPSATSTSTAK